jgi:hypothetical protein
MMTITNATILLFFHKQFLRVRMVLVQTMGNAVEQVKAVTTKRMTEGPLSPLDPVTMKPSAFDGVRSCVTGPRVCLMIKALLADALSCIGRPREESVHNSRSTRCWLPSSYVFEPSLA